MKITITQYSKLLTELLKNAGKNQTSPLLIVEGDLGCGKLSILKSIINKYNLKANLKDLSISEEFDQENNVTAQVVVYNEADRYFSNCEKQVMNNLHQNKLVILLGTNFNQFQISQVIFNRLTYIQL